MLSRWLAQVQIGTVPLCLVGGASSQGLSRGHSMEGLPTGGVAAALRVLPQAWDSIHTHAGLPLPSPMVSLSTVLFEWGSFAENEPGPLGGAASPWWAFL